MDDKALLDKMTIRYTEPSDGPYLKKWLMDPAVLSWFPMIDELEIDDAVNRWIYLCRYRCAITAVIDGVPVGFAALYLQPYKKLAHQTEFGIIVDPNYRGKGLGTKIMLHLFELAKTKFKIELIHLQVYSDNPAIHLYQRLGFIEFGRQSHWIREADGKPVARIMMERFI